MTTPNRLFNELLEYNSFKTDTTLAAWLGIPRSMLSMMRAKDRDIGAGLILKVYDRTGWSVERIRQLAGAGPL
jgi:plasmid maintenance system antidote protein VapI